MAGRPQQQQPGGGFVTLYPRPEDGGMVDVPLAQAQVQQPGAQAPVPDLYPTYEMAPAAYAQSGGPQQPAVGAVPGPGGYYGGGPQQSVTPEVSVHGADPYFKHESKWNSGAQPPVNFLNPNAPRPPSKFGSFRQSGSFRRPSNAPNANGAAAAAMGAGAGAAAMAGGADPNAAGGVEGAQQPPPQGGEAPKYQDAWAALLFLAHLVVIFWVAFDYGLPMLEHDVKTAENQDGSDFNIANDSMVALVSGGVVCTLAAAAFSYIWLKYVLKDARGVIHFMLMASVAMQVATAVLSMLAGQIWLFVMSLVFCMVTLCYYRLVRNRIPFASTNLAVATKAIGNASGPVLVSFLVIFVQLCWQFVWTLAMMGAVLPQGGYQIQQGGQSYSEFECENRFSNTQQTYICVCAHSGTEQPTYAYGRCQYGSAAPAFYLFLLLISAFWGSLVLQYLVHCTTAGVVAEWWFTGTSAGATWASFKRAITTSFGSICFGSLFLSIVRAAHQMLVEMRKSENNACVCLADCLLQCIDAVATYFNRYAFTYCAMYGTSFVEGGKEAFNLFHQRGLDAIINDQLISNVFTLMAFGSGVLVALVGYGFALAFNLEGGYRGLMAGLGFILGLMVCSIVLSVIDAAVCTVFVCFAEAPEALQQNSPELHGEMVKCWTEAMQPPR